MAEKKLSALFVERIRKPGKYPDGGGLILQVTVGADGAPRKSWLYRFLSPETGKERSIGLRTFPQVSLAAARAARDEARALVEKRVDPIQQWRVRDWIDQDNFRERMFTFDDCADAYIEAHKATWRNAKHAQQWENTLRTYASPVIGRLKVAQIDTPLILKVLERDQLWTKKTETANRVRGRIETILAWAKVRGYRGGDNPALWRGHLDQVLPAPAKIRPVKHQRSVDYHELPELMERLGKPTPGSRSFTASASAYALMLAILTATRTSETLKAKWAEIDIENRLWIIPANRTKGNREFRVPLSGPALDILKVMASIRLNDFVFPGLKPNRPLSNMAMLQLLRRMDVNGVTHGMRASFKTWAHETQPFATDIVEACLSHVTGSKVEQAYQRSDILEKRRAVMDAWAAFLKPNT